MECGVSEHDYYFILWNMYILIPMNAAISPNLGPNWSTLESHYLAIKGHGTGGWPHSTRNGLRHAGVIRLSYVS